MDYRSLGQCGLKVSPICLGTMMFGDRTDAREAGRIVASAREAGVNFIDTADVYAKGESEKITGKVIASDRIYYLHRDMEDTPIEETVTAMGDLMRAGKIRHFGVSNFRGWRIAEVVHACNRLGIPRPVASQPYYNAMNRQPENEILPACAHHGIGVVPYSPLARGVLTGKYKPGAPPEAESRAGRKDKRFMETEFREESLAIAQKVKSHAEKKGMSPGHLAFNWVLANPIVTSVIAGPRTMGQWTDYLAALGRKFESEDESLFDSLVHPGHPSTPGYNDPNYPLRGRPVSAG